MKPLVSFWDGNKSLLSHPVQENPPLQRWNQAETEIWKDLTKLTERLTAAKNHLCYAFNQKHVIRKECHLMLMARCCSEAGLLPQTTVRAGRQDVSRIYAQRSKHLHWSLFSFFQLAAFPRPCSLIYGCSGCERRRRRAGFSTMQAWTRTKDAARSCAPGRSAAARGRKTRKRDSLSPNHTLKTRVFVLRRQE